MEGRENRIKTIQKFKGSTASLSDKEISVYDNIAVITGKAKFYVKTILVAEIFYTEIHSNAIARQNMDSRYIHERHRQSMDKSWANLPACRSKQKVLN
jgi:hypothetical protein